MFNSFHANVPLPSPLERSAVKTLKQRLSSSFVAYIVIFNYRGIQF